MSYDEKYRKRAIEYKEEGHTYKETAKVFGISPNTLNTWINQYRKTGNLKQKRRIYESKIPQEALKAYIKANPDAYQYETAEHFQCSQSTICRELKRLKITRKKRQSVIKNKTKKK